jgi:hypothetical protein
MADENNNKLLELLNNLNNNIAVLSEATNSRIAESAKNKTAAQRAAESQENFAKEIKETTELLKDNKISARQAKEIVKQLTEEQKKLGIESSEVLVEFRKLKEQTAVIGLSWNSLKTSFLDSSKSIVIGAASFSKGIIDASQTADPLTAAFQTATSASKGLSGAANKTGDVMNLFGSAIMGKSKIAGGALKVLGGTAKTAGLAAEMYGKALDLARPYIVNFQESFKKANEAGAVFAGGMSELRNDAGQAGTTMDNLVGGISKVSDSFLAGGANFSQASKIIASTNKSLVEGKAATDLFALGFTDVQSRISLAGQAFERARFSGMNYSDAQKNITELTVQYGKDLKILSTIAGKNAEEALRQAQIERTRGALLGKLGPDSPAAKAFDAFFVKFKSMGPEGERLILAYEQRLLNKPITDAGIRVDQVTNQMIESAVASTKGFTGTVADAGVLVGKTFDKAGEDAAGPMGRFGRMMDEQAIGLSKNAPEIVTSISSMHNALLAQNKQQGAAAEDAANATGKVTSNLDATTTSFSNINEAMNKFKTSLDQFFTGPTAVSTLLEPMKIALDKTNDTIDKFRDKLGNIDLSKLTTFLSGINPSALGTDALVGTAGAIAGELLLRKYFGGGGPKGGTGFGPKTPTGGGGLHYPTGAAGEKIGIQMMESTAEGVERTIASGGFLGTLTEKIGSLFAGAAATGGALLEKGKEKLGGLGNAGKLAGKLGSKSIPFLGALTSALLTYSESGSIGKSIFAGAGTLGGQIVGGIGGAAVGGAAGAGIGAVPGAVVGEVTGSIAGEHAMTRLYDYLFGSEKEKPRTATPSEKQSQVDKTSSLADQTENVLKAANAAAGITPSVTDETKKIVDNQTTDKFYIDPIETLNGKVERMISILNELNDGMRNVASNTKNTYYAVG